MPNADSVRTWDRRKYWTPRRYFIPGPYKIIPARANACIPRPSTRRRASQTRIDGTRPADDRRVVSGIAVYRPEPATSHQRGLERSGLAFGCGHGRFACGNLQASGLLVEAVSRP
jgi:hypothetical protein